MKEYGLMAKPSDRTLEWLLGSRAPKESVHTQYIPRMLGWEGVPHQVG